MLTRFGLSRKQLRAVLASHVPARGDGTSARASALAYCALTCWDRCSAPRRRNGCRAAPRYSRFRRRALRRGSCGGAGAGRAWRAWCGASLACSPSRSRSAPRSGRAWSEPPPRRAPSSSRGTSSRSSPFPSSASSSADPSSERRRPARERRTRRRAVRRRASRAVLPAGHAALLAHVLVTALQLIAAERASAADHPDDFAARVNLAMTPVFLVGAARERGPERGPSRSGSVRAAFAEFAATIRELPPARRWTVLATVPSATALSWAQARAQRNVSATTIAACNNAAKWIHIAAATTAFGEPAPKGTRQWLGIALTFVGDGVYTRRREGTRSIGGTGGPRRSRR